MKANCPQVSKPGKTRSPRSAKARNNASPFVRPLTIDRLALWQLEARPARPFVPAGTPLLQQECSLMLKLSNLCLAALALLGASVPLAALTGYDSPACGWSSVWSFSGIHYQYVCF